MNVLERIKIADLVNECVARKVEIDRLKERDSEARRIIKWVGSRMMYSLLGGSGELWQRRIKKWLTGGMK